MEITLQIRRLKAQGPMLVKSLLSVHLDAPQEDSANGHEFPLWESPTHKKPAVYNKFKSSRICTAGLPLQITKQTSPHFLNLMRDVLTEYNICALL